MLADWPTSQPSAAAVRRDERGKRRLGFYAKLSPNNPKKKNVGHPCIKWVRFWTHHTIRRRWYTILVRNNGKHKSETSFEHIRASTTVYIITNSFRIQCVFIIFFGSHASPFKTNPVKVNLNLNADATIKAYYKNDKKTWV